MEATAVIKWNGNEYGEHSTLFAQLSPLQAAQIAASKYGFFDLDVDADDRVVRIVATAKGRSFTAQGKSLTLAVESLLETLTDEQTRSGKPTQGRRQQDSGIRTL